MPNTGAVFTSTSTSTDTTTNPSTQTNPSEFQTQSQSQTPGQCQGAEEQLLAEDAGQAAGIENGNHSPANTDDGVVPLDVDPDSDQEHKENQDFDDEDDIHFDERLFVEAADIGHPGDDQLPESDDEEVEEALKKEVKTEPEQLDGEEDQDVQASTPKTSKIRLSLKTATPLSSPESEGIVLDFQSTTQNISPILKAINECDLETDDLPITENDLKRKRDSFDNVSLMSVDSFALPTSTKKPKLIRTGSISRTLRRSVSFVAEPLMKTLRPRRSSVADASTFLGSEAADDSICSLASSINLTLNESIKKPVKDKLRSFCGRITRSSSRRVERGAEGTPECSAQLDSGFKTPKAPKIRSSATPKTAKRLFGPVVSALTLTNPSTPTLVNPLPIPTPTATVTASLDVNDTSSNTFAFCAAAVTPAMPPVSSSSSSSSPILSTSIAVHSSVQVINKSPEESTAGRQTLLEEPMQMVLLNWIRLLLMETLKRQRILSWGYNFSLKLRN